MKSFWPCDVYASVTEFVIDLDNQIIVACSVPRHVIRVAVVLLSRRARSVHMVRLRDAHIRQRNKSPTSDDSSPARHKPLPKLP